MEAEAKYKQLEEEHGPNTAKLQRWIDDQVANHDLVHFSFTPAWSTILGEKAPPRVTVESLATELLAWIEEPECEEDPDFF